MSVQEAFQQPKVSLSLKLEAKPRPEIPPKPSTQTCSPPEDGGSSKNISSGKVKSIVNKFSKQDSALEEQPINGTAELEQCKSFKSPPPVKPKPSRSSQQLHVEVEQAPPLPVKRRGTLQKQKRCAQREEGDTISVAGRRSGTVDFSV